jgi:hypothetical protein
MFCCLLKSVVEERFLREDPQYAAYTQNICELAASDQSTKHGRRTEAHFDVSDKDLALIGVGTFLALSLVTGKPEGQIRQQWSGAQIRIRLLKRGSGSQKLRAMSLRLLLCAGTPSLLML